MCAYVDRFVCVYKNDKDPSYLHTIDPHFDHGGCNDSNVLSKAVVSGWRCDLRACTGHTAG